MKFAHSIKQKTKVALLLFCIMVCLILVRILEDKSIKQMSNSFVSLYNDRLIPATDLFFIAEKLNIKKDLIESYVNNEFALAKPNNINERLLVYNESIDSLLLKYEKTYLVSLEKKHLVELKSNILASRIIEENIINNLQLKEKPSTQSISILLNDSYKGIFNKLSELTQIQSKIGDELIKSSKSIVSGSNLYSTIQFFLAIIIGILIVSILFTSNVINIKNENFNLN
ncbi:MAG: MCP four helix bundle domain-containing protein [Sphingobacteriaceae bacterium]|nr:MCP four helix bundle domain-containing protein [Sphingobacteriaceae bacterium]